MKEGQIGHAAVAAGDESPSGTSGGSAGSNVPNGRDHQQSDPTSLQFSSNDGNHSTSPQVRHSQHQRIVHSDIRLRSCLVFVCVAPPASKDRTICIPPIGASSAP
jgi:hypothetical protein